MKATMVIPSYWSRESYKERGIDDEIYDHPTPLDKDGTLLRTLQSIKVLKSRDFQLVVIAVPTSDDIGHGKILNMNTDYAFVVIDLGQQMGVRKGMVFDVFRRNKFLGRIEVIQLRKKIAACDIVQADTLFKPGDTVRY